MCEFQSLYFGDDGYVVRCNKCGHYQVAFASSMLNLTVEDFKKIRSVVKQKNDQPDHYNNPTAKAIVVPTPSKGIYMLLTKNETTRLYEILEEADNEEKALELMGLFHQ
ncbi:MAG: DUF6686 family protein [Bacteroidota bacterium]